jgi:hypothetical protein
MMYYLLFAVFLLIVAQEAYSYYRTRASSSDGWPTDTVPPFEITKLVVSAFVLAAIVRTLLLEPFNIPSGSDEAQFVGGGLSVCIQVFLMAMAAILSR